MLSDSDKSESVYHSVRPIKTPEGRSAAEGTAAIATVAATTIYYLLFITVSVTQRDAGVRLVTLSADVAR